jgi:RimJ/RimL family protein N-acetyltransferase
MKITYSTERLSLEKLSDNDADFILELVNTAGWLKFIGERNVKTKANALNYVQKINANANIIYWVVHLHDTHAPIGIVTLIKRDYLDYHDIGFAFLPQYARQGFAYEATNAVLQDLFFDKKYKTILASTIINNESSIQLLKKLGFSFSKELKIGNDELYLFSITKDEK